MSDSSIQNKAYLTEYSSTPTLHEDETFFTTHPWIRHYEQGVPVHITVPDYPLTRLIEDTANQYPNSIALLYYETTITFARLLHYVDQFAAALHRLGVKKGDRVAIALPNIPQYPIAFYGALKAGAVVVPTNPLYTGREIQYQLADSGARVLVMLALMCEAAPHPEALRSIKYCISGAAPLPAQVQADFESITHGKLVEGYGLSEAGPVTHCNPLTRECRNGTIGLPLPDIEAAIVNQETGEPVSVGELGELVVKGPNIMQGYWHRQEETQEIFRDGWLRTGDLGKMDEDGYFSILERIKDVIIASGFKVYPREVEEIFFQHSAVAEAAVVGIPDAYRGETVAAFVVLKPGIEASENTRRKLLQFCEQRLTAYKVPRMLLFRESLPKSLIGKVLRRELRSECTA